MQSIQKAFDECLETRLNWVKKVAESQAKIAPYIRQLEALTHALDGRLGTYYSDDITLSFTTSDMKGLAARVLEAVSHITGEEFATSSDMAEEWGASRQFRSASLPLVVMFALDDSGAGCRKVQVGVKEVPIYKLECDDTGEQPL